jgi:hypothetical protein
MSSTNVCAFMKNFFASRGGAIFSHILLAELRYLNTWGNFSSISLGCGLLKLMLLKMETAVS